MKNPLTLESFAEWCESKPADEEYEYDNPDQCAVAQYLAACGFDVRALGHRYWCDRRGVSREVPAGFSEASRVDPMTFGALAKRLREATP